MAPERYTHVAMMSAAVRTDVCFFLFSRDTAQTVKERFGKKLYESLLV